MGWINWKNLPHDRGDPATKAQAIVPSDTIPLPLPAKSIWTGSGGTLKVLLSDDTTPVTFSNVLAGQIMYICVAQVYATGTTCNNLMALS